MYYGSEKEYTSFKVFAKAVKEYIHYFNKERIQMMTARGTGPPVRQIGPSFPMK
ncbi:IS3 family transposase [Acidaminococcus intestini]|uniref:IS3 family transposase n=1 Tax=Acidaminococcus intestini TaxID=187327 RepID=UPI003C6CAE4C